jgi:branched-chain amino acid transport system ATP-binding protein
MAVSTASLLEVCDATLCFGAVQALDGVDVGVAEGSVTAVIGPNGAGKTSLFNAISGLCRLTSGRVLFDGRDIGGQRPDAIARLGIARTFQNLDLFPTLTVIDNVRLGRHTLMRGGLLAGGLGLTRRHEAQHEHSVLDVLDLCDLRQVRDERVASLPYGLQKRVEIARSAAMEPRLLLLDEPAAGMHAEEKQLVASVVARLRRHAGVTVLLVEHDVSFVASLSDVVVVLDFGRRIAVGPPDVVLHDDGVRRAYLGAVSSGVPA